MINSGHSHFWNLLLSFTLAFAAAVFSLLMTLWLEKRRKLNEDGKLIEKIQYAWTLIVAEFMFTSIQIEWLAKNREKYLSSVIPTLPIGEFESFNQMIAKSDIDGLVYYQVSQFVNITKIKLRELQRRCQKMEIVKNGDGIKYGKDIIQFVLHHIQHLQINSKSHFDKNRYFLLPRPAMTNCIKTGEHWAQGLVAKYEKEFGEECPIKPEEIFSQEIMKEIEKKCKAGEF